MTTYAFKVRQALDADLTILARRYIAHHKGDALEGLAALGEDLLRMADRTEGRTSWLALLTRLQQLSG